MKAIKCPKDKARFEAFPVPGCVAANYPQHVLKQTASSPPKKRQTACNSRESVIVKYKKDVSSVWRDRTIRHEPWFQPNGLYLSCKSIEPTNLPVGFTNVGGDRYQYNFTDPEAPDKAKKRYRPVAYRVPFCADTGYYDKNMTVSHLCHNNWCYNWNHHVLESLSKNKARNGCPAGPSCRHKTKCLIPGEESET